MSQEGMSREEPVSGMNAPKGRAVETGWGKEMRLESLSEEYKALQMQIIKLDGDLERGNERAMQEKNPGARDLAIAIGRKINEELQALQGKKGELENRITTAGGNPSDYTIQ